MKTHHHKCKSKRTKLSLKYNIQKRIREHKRRLKKQARKMGLQKMKSKDPGIPNSWPLKAEMLQGLQEKQAKREEDMVRRRAKAKSNAKRDHKREEIHKREAHRAREAERREKRAQEAEQWQTQLLRKNLPQADVVLQVLDARDPMGCRCAALESWALENQKRLMFVLTKADLVTPDVVAKWIIALGQIGPTVAVQAEAGREGIRELLLLLGHPVPSETVKLPPQLKAAAAVVVVGYPGTGKRALCKAMRQELKTTAAWLLDACKLRPVAGQAPTVVSALHSALCSHVPRGAANATSATKAVASGSHAGVVSGVEATDVIKELLSRVQQQTVLRHFRLPAFEGAEGFLKIFAEDRKLKTKKNKLPLPPAIAQRVLTELSALPGCFCEPADAKPADSSRLWPSHGDAREVLQQAMTQQVAALNSRGKSGPALGALVIASSSQCGPNVDIAGALTKSEEDELDLGGDDAASEESELDDDDMDDDEEGLEGEEEEEFEGEESEEDMDDE